MRSASLSLLGSGTDYDDGLGNGSGSGSGSESGNQQCSKGKSAANKYKQLKTNCLNQQMFNFKTGLRMCRTLKDPVARKKRFSLVTKRLSVQIPGWVIGCGALSKAPNLHCSPGRPLLLACLCSLLGWRGNAEVTNWCKYVHPVEGVLTPLDMLSLELNSRMVLVCEWGLTLCYNLPTDQSFWPLLLMYDWNWPIYMTTQVPCTYDSYQICKHPKGEDQWCDVWRDSVLVPKHKTKIHHKGNRSRTISK